MTYLIFVIMENVSKRTLQRRKRNYVSRMIERTDMPLRQIANVTESHVYSLPHVDDENIAHDFDNEMLDVDVLECDSSSDSEYEVICTVTDPKKLLVNWALNHNVTHSALNDLFPIIRKFCPTVNLPALARTFFGSERPTDKIVSMGKGSFCYFGLKAGITRRFNAGVVSFPLPTVAAFEGLQQDKTLSITVGIDGLPISKSSRKQFWPILARLDQSKDSMPFPVAIYYGEEKPPVSEFLKDFVDECLHYEQAGFTAEGTVYGFRVRCVVADAPARSYLKCCANFNAHYGCERCEQRGKWKEHRMLFLECNAPVRHDACFNNPVNESHVRGVSPLSSLKFGLVTQFPIDYMHLCCLNVMRRLLRTWVKGKLPHRLHSSLIDRINLRIEMFRKYIPSDFVRKGRSLREIDNWKATELRTFLLYTGPVALKGILPAGKYRHFLLLSLGTYILLLPNCNLTWKEAARNLLIQFVSNVPKLYSKTLVVSSFHSLIHLADDAIRFGSLNNCNAFCFENYMQVLKKMLRGKSHYLQQAVNRLHEYEHLSGVLCSQKDTDRFDIKPDNANGFIVTKSGDFCRVVDQKPSGYIVNVYRRSVAVGDYACNSMLLHISFLSDLCCTSKLVQYSEIHKKCVCLPMAEAAGMFFLYSYNTQ